MNSNLKFNFFSKSYKKLVAPILLLSFLTGHIYTPVIFGLTNIQKISDLSIRIADAQVQTSIQNQAILSIPEGFTFSQNLSFGQTISPDVSYLQLILNSDNRTVVSLSGAGSNQNPTNYFGQKTRDAVIRFQNIYASEVLAPAGLTTPTGFVGSFTRAKLNQLLSDSPQDFGVSNLTPAQPQTSQPISPQSQMIANTTNTTNSNPDINLFKVRTNSGIEIYTLSPDMLRLANSTRTSINGFSSYIVQRDQTLTMTGTGFTTSNNVVYFGSIPTGPYASLNGGTFMNIKVPTTIPDGNYLVSLDNRNGLKTSAPIYLTVQGGTLLSKGDKPVLSSVSPGLSSFLNQPITIFGRNFLTRNNIITNLGTINNAFTSDPERLTFLPGQLPNYLTALSQYRGQEVNLLIRVRNDMGTSDQELSHIIRFASSTYPLLTKDRDLLDPPIATSTNASSSTPTARSNVTVTDISNEQAPIMETIKSSSPSENQSRTNSSESSNAGAVAAVAGVAVGVGVAASLLSKAAAPVIDYFGGKITKSTICTCSPGEPTLLTIENFNPKMPPSIEVMYIPGVSALKANFNIWTTGVYTIGGMIEGGDSCLVTAVPVCRTAGTAQYTVDSARGIGTSLTAPAV